MGNRSLLGAAKYIATKAFGARGAVRLRQSNLSSKKYFLSAMIRVKNEARFLPELICYWKNIGVEKFYIYDNNSDDQTSSVIDGYVKSGLVTIVVWPTVPAAPSCYEHFFREYSGESRWVAFVDADEFLVEASPGLLIETLKNSEALCALAVHWRYFGSSGHREIPDGLILENFTKADRKLNEHIKVICQPRLVDRYYNPHNFIYKDARFAKTISGSIALASRAEIGESEGLVINHYVYRSQQNYLAKSKMGFADADGYKNAARRAELSEFEFHKHNEVDISVEPSIIERVRTDLLAAGFGPPFVSSDIDVCKR